MLVTAVSFQNPVSKENRKNNLKTSFTSVHPTVYFVKQKDGKYVQVTAKDTIKTLQRKIITWLNKAYNDANNMRNGKVPKASKSESNEDKILKMKLVRFFQMNDPDYAKRPFVRSYYTENQNGKMYSFILSGPSCDLVEAAAKPIGRARGVIKTKKDNIINYFGVDEQRAKNYISRSEVNSIGEAAKNYRSDAEKIIKNLLSQNRPKDMRFEAYFAPYMKGKEIKYNLEGAYLKREVKL